MKSTRQPDGASTEAVGLGRRRRRGLLHARFVSRLVRRSSVFEHICSVLEKTVPTHVIGSKLFTSWLVSHLARRSPVPSSSSSS